MSRQIVRSDTRVVDVVANGSSPMTSPDLAEILAIRADLARDAAKRLRAARKAIRAARRAVHDMRAAMGARD